MYKHGQLKMLTGTQIFSKLGQVVKIKIPGALSP